ncbi:MAG: 16S rRNA (cytidine(1402)-2'-O)-methyltransferase [bacterium]
MDSGILYIVGTPIGNLQDITLRALDTLKSVDLVLCEDTRVSRKLLSHYNISTRVESLHAHTNPEKISRIIHQITTGTNAALISDAGTPTISDPGSLLLEAAWQAKIKIVPIPGPSAVTTAISVSGFCDKGFLFLGFIPKKKGREKFLKKITENDYPVVFFESVHQIQKLLLQLQQILHPDRKILITRELTKLYETIFRGKIQDFNISDLGQIKGEFTIVIDKNPSTSFPPSLKLRRAGRTR